jgi:exonuclease III
MMNAGALGGDSAVSLRGAWTDTGLRDLGYRDVFRALHGYARSEPSWTWRRRAGHDGGWRLDHLFASAELRPVSCRYHHAWRDAGLSDHSALEAELEHQAT